LRSVPVTVAATPPHSPSNAEALALLLLAACDRQRQEIDRLAAERTALEAANQGRLAHPGLPAQEHQRALAVGCVVHGMPQRRQLLVALQHGHAVIQPIRAGRVRTVRHLVTPVSASVSPKPSTAPANGASAACRPAPRPSARHVVNRHPGAHSRAASTAPFATG